MPTFNKNFLLTPLFVDYTCLVKQTTKLCIFLYLPTFQVNKTTVSGLVTDAHTTTG